MSVTRKKATNLWRGGCFLSFHDCFCLWSETLSSGSDLRQMLRYQWQSTEAQNYSIEPFSEFPIRIPPLGGSPDDPSIERRTAYRFGNAQYHCIRTYVRCQWFGVLYCVYLRFILYTLSAIYTIYCSILSAYKKDRRIWRDSPKLRFSHPCW